MLEEIQMSSSEPHFLYVYFAEKASYKPQLTISWELRQY